MDAGDDMTRSGTYPTLSGGIDVLHPAPRVVELRVHGFCTRQALQRALDDAGCLLDLHPEIDTMVWDALAMTGHEPGNAALGVRWIAQWRERVRQAVLVNRTPSVSNLARAMLILVPFIRLQVVSRRDEVPVLPPGRVRDHSAA